ncbi:hypothetical protein N2603_38325 [Bradyrhizobium huanghuaihaiense]|uniref:hypothetical protein n=1 Tax=Bradyrhizobium huanghuaihaiense TaxID=990078 RepID=UPI0021AAF80E|nr:hypothetical protein [Bradyrhizobium sp. CB3035]UWU75778.1 hypothetical protein N2603_38325 [Bradyrhizobium sp. CB3035]
MDAKAGLANCIAKDIMLTDVWQGDLARLDRDAQPVATLAQIELFTNREGRQVREKDLRAAEDARAETRRAPTSPRSRGVFRFASKARQYPA